MVYRKRSYATTRYKELMATQLEILLENIAILEANGASQRDIEGVISDFGYTKSRFENAAKRFAESGGKVTPSNALANILRGFTLGASDAIEAGARSLVGPETYAQERAAIRLGEEEYAEDYPVEKFTQEFAGAIPTSMAASMAVPGSGVAVQANRLQNFLRALPVAMGEGAVAGYFGGDADPLSGEALGDAAIGAGLGAAFTGTGSVGALKDAISPAFLNKEQERIVAEVLKDAATNPQSAARNLAENAEVLVPGSVPTTAQVAKDPGLAGLETGVRGLDQSNRIGQRIGEQQTARANEMQRLAGTEDDLARLKDRRDAITAPMREQAFDQGGMIDNPVDIIDSFTALANRPGIKGRRSVRAIIERFRNDVKMLATDPDDPDNLLPIDPRDLYAVRQEIGDLMSGRLQMDETSAAKLSKKELIELQQLIDDEIELVAPGFQDYLQTYAARSKPVNRMETVQDLQRRAQVGTDLQTLEPVLSPFKMRNAINAKKREFNRLPLSNKKRVNAIMRDLNRSTATTAPGVKVPGSDTFKNLSMAAAIGRVFGDTATDAAIPSALMSPFKALYGITRSDEKMTELLIQAMLDPELSARLLSRATEENANNFVSALKRRLPAFFYAQGAAMAGLNVD